MYKADLRKQALKQRKAMSEAELAAANEKLLEGFKTLDLSKTKSIHLFLPIAHQNEPNTFLIIDWLQTNHPEIEIVVPKADFASNLMSHYVYVSKNELLNNHYHIPEPQQGKAFTTMPDLVLVPLLAIDSRGYRVGYGKGFYDRFLEHSSAQKVGLSFFEPVEKITDVHLNDIRLDKCITPHGIIDFNV